MSDALLCGIRMVHIFCTKVRVHCQERCDYHSLFGSMQVDDRAGFIQLSRYQSSLLDCSCLDVLSLKRKRCSPCAVSNLISGFILPT